LQPLLNLLAKNGIAFQAFADDLALLLKNQQQLNTSLQCIQIYEEASGAKLNKNKSVAISPHNNNLKHPFPNTNTPQVYLGFLLNHNGELTIPEEIIEKASSNLSKWKNLPLSLKGKINTIKSYIRPLFLYHLTICPTPPSIVKYINKENWFLSSNSAPFDPEHKYQPPMGKERALHPLTNLGFWTLDFSINTRRAKILNSLNFLIQNQPKTNQQLKSPPLIIDKQSITHLLESSREIRKMNINENSNIKESLLKKPIPITEAQRKWIKEYKTNLTELLMKIEQSKLRNHIKSFAWKLINKKLNLGHIYNDACPICNQELEITEHLFSNCNENKQLLHSN
jgi:hypothetical protein